MGINNKSVENNYFCVSNAILVSGMCNEFHWTSEISKIRYTRDHFTINIMMFKHIFETIALEKPAFISLSTKKYFKTECCEIC